MAQNFYVYDGAAPSLAGTPYQGYTLVARSAFNNAYNTSGYRLDADANVVVGGSVNGEVNLNPDYGNDTGFPVNVTVLGNTNSFNIVVTNSSGLVTTDPNVTVNVLGDAPNVNLSGNNNLNALTVNIADEGSFGNIDANGASTSNLTTINVGTNASVGNINADTDTNDRLILNAKDGATIGNVTSGSSGLTPTLPPIYYETGGADRITLGNNVTIGSVTTNDGADSITAGSNLTVNGTISTGEGPDRITLGEGATVNGNILTGTDVATNDADGLTVGANSSITGYINTNVGNDTVAIGDNVTISGTNGIGAAIDTYIGDDHVTIGEGVVTNSDIFTGAGSDTIVGPARGDFSSNMGNLGGDGDLPVLTGMGTVPELRAQLIRQGFTDPDGDGIYSGPSNGTFNYNGNTYTNVNRIEAIPCFTSGKMIDTPTGPVRVETLAAGDLVLTRDHGARPLRWTGMRGLSAGDLDAVPSLRPIRIRAGALGAGTPSADLLVSPQHRILVRSAIAQRMFGTDEILVAAKQLVALDGIEVAADVAEVEYVHILFDQHEIVMSNGAATESLYVGSEALKSVGPAAAEEIFALFPELRQDGHSVEPARLLAGGRMGRQLALRHVRNGKPLIG